MDTSEMSFLTALYTTSNFGKYGRSKVIQGALWKLVDVYHAQWAISVLGTYMFTEKHVHIHYSQPLYKQYAVF